jgi:Ran GTPase-activating protein (RanGAP) involved in mRNA processing and transport
MYSACAGCVQARTLQRHNQGLKIMQLTSIYTSQESTAISNSLQVSAATLLCCSQLNKPQQAQDSYCELNETTQHSLIDTRMQLARKRHDGCEL